VVCSACVVCVFVCVFVVCVVCVWYVCMDVVCVCVVCVYVCVWFVCMCVYVCVCVWCVYVCVYVCVCVVCYPYYYIDEEVVVSGNVSPLIEDSLVSITLFFEDGGIIAVDLVTVAFDGSYTATFLPDILWEQGGDIIVSASYYAEFTETKFNYRPEVELLENGCPADFPYLWEDGLCHTTIELVYKESEMGFYTNDRYDFSLEAPFNWNYQEGVVFDETITSELVLFPSEFHVSNAGDDANMIDVQTAMRGWQFQFDL